MKRSLALMGTTMAVCALACAQEYSGNRVVVPGRNGSHARTVEANIIHGSIVVKTGSGNDVIVETDAPRGRGPADSRTPSGMHRIDPPWNSPLQVEERGDVIHINVTPRGEPDTVTVTVPANISLKLNVTHGDTKVDGVHGEVDAESTHGDVTLTNISGTVVANTVHGSLKVSMNQVDQSKPLAFTTLSGEIDVTLPADGAGQRETARPPRRNLERFRYETHRHLHLRRPRRLRPLPDHHGPRRMNGTINGGGVDTTFYTVNGKITIRKR